MQEVFITNNPSAIVSTSGRVLATFPINGLQAGVQSQQDELPIFYRQQKRIEWYRLQAREIVYLNPKDEIGVGLPHDYEPSLYQRIVPQKSH